MGPSKEGYPQHTGSPPELVCTVCGVATNVALTLMLGKHPTGKLTCGLNDHSTMIVAVVVPLASIGSMPLDQVL